MMQRTIVEVSLAVGLVLGTVSVAVADFPIPVTRCGADAMVAGTVCLDKYEASVCTGNWRPTSALSPRADAVAAPSEPALRLGRLHRTRPDRLRVPIYSATPAALSALSFRVRYDATVLRVTGVRRFGRAQAGMLQFNTREPGVVAVAWASAAPIASENQPLLTIQFEPRSPGRALGSPLELIEARREQP